MVDRPSPEQPLSRFMEAAGFDMSEVGPTRVVGSIELGADHHQPWGIVHGGVYASAVETAASVGASIAAGEHGQVAVGVNNSTNFLRSMREGTVTVEARSIHQGRTQQLWEVQITDDRDRLVATGQVRLQNVAPRT